ncbi:hypothetical protein M23134_01184 [Microscilla marina ATCC 23134]|uniref:Uncharacterized protein n=1 Tax=Microscilla marina ATCC 23134 TaxID=313606 RepID=A1ZFT6_MICM2|nr:hypothetical protein M23134_01184 [Microscilla marina ATCC 23134]
MTEHLLIRNPVIIFFHAIPKISYLRTLEHYSGHPAVRPLRGVVV